MRFFLPTLVVRNLDHFPVPRGAVSGRYFEDAVNVEIECHLNLRYSSRSWRDTIEIEASEQMVVSCQCSFAFVYEYSHTYNEQLELREISKRHARKQDTVVSGK